jgi:hypothetical protein
MRTYHIDSFVRLMRQIDFSQAVQDEDFENIRAWTQAVEDDLDNHGTLVEEYTGKLGRVYVKVDMDKLSKIRGHGVGVLKQLLPEGEFLQSLTWLEEFDVKYASEQMTTATFRPSILKLAVSVISQATTSAGLATADRIAFKRRYSAVDVADTIAVLIDDYLQSILDQALKGE